MKPLLFLIFGLLLLAGCDAQVKDRTDRQLAKMEIEAKEACDKGQCPCPTPLGSVNHGSKVTLYSQGTAACNEGCGKFSSEAVCDNGELKKANGTVVDTEGLFFKCAVAECPECRLGDNLIRNGETIAAFKTGMVGCRESCEDVKQMRTCEMGKLTGSDTYASAVCDSKICRCELPDSSSYLSLDGKVTLYSTEQATCGTTCADFQQVRTCTASGSGASETYALDGSSAYRYRECRGAENCFCTLPNNLGILAHGMTKTISQVATVGCGQSCVGQPSVTVKCDNGVLKNTALTQVIDFTTETYSPYKHECTVDSCVSCPLPGSSVRIAHGDSFSFAKAPSVSCGQSCEYKSRTCNNGVFVGDTAYSALSCATRTCTCNVPGLTGVKVPIGSTWKFYSALVPQCSQTCDGISSLKTCTEVDTGGVYSYVFLGSSAHTQSSCSPPTGCACPLPGELGSIADKKSVTLTSEATVPCGKSCSDIPSINAMCANGILFRTDDQSLINASDPAYPYRYYCNQSTCQACNLPGYGSIQNSAHLTLYSKGVMTCADDPARLSFDFGCENGVLVKNGLPYNPANDPNKPAAWFTSYTVDCPGCNLPWGGFIAEGGTVNAYKYFGTVINNCGRGCKISERKCVKGKLDGDDSYNLASCNNTCDMEGGGAPPRACLLPWQNSFVTPDSQIPMWSKKHVPCTDSCQNYFVLPRCEMKTGGFQVPFDYSYSSCAELCPN